LPSDYVDIFYTVYPSTQLSWLSWVLLTDGCAEMKQMHKQPVIGASRLIY